MNSRELPQDRLSTTDQEGRRVYLYPADVRGYWRNLRPAMSFVLIVIFLVLPWIKIGGHPIILLDIARLKFSILGFRFWAHDVPMLFFVAGAVLVSIAFVTAVWGRLWCGWACPQTVFVDSVFRRIERWIEGDSVQRKRLDESPWSGEKVLLKSAKWFLFTLVSLILGHSFLAYFTGTEALAQMVRSSPAENPGSFFLMALVTGGVLFDFGWFREQFCTVVCPYGRFQSVLMDDRSMVVAYDVQRGEPRKGVAPSGIPLGDCVNCYKCVAVCPTGIDIRRGVQLECIACTACIDVCNDVMHRLGRPENLIRYTTQSERKGETISALRARPLVYLILVALLIGGLVLTLRHREVISVDLVRAVGAPYQEIKHSNGSDLVINHFRADLRNQGFEPVEVRLDLSEDLKKQGAEVVMASQPTSLQPGEMVRVNLFARFPRTLLQGGRLVALIEVQWNAVAGKPGVITKEVKFVGPLL